MKGEHRAWWRRPFAWVVPLAVLVPLALVASSLALFAGVGEAAALPNGFAIEGVVDGLQAPVAVGFSTTGRMFVAEKRGVIRVVRDGVLLPTPFINLATDVNDYFEHGMLGMALHPNFPTVPYVYVLYVYDPPGVTKDTAGARVARLERITANPQNPDVAATTAGSRTVLLGGNGDASTITDPTATPNLTCWRNGAQVQNCIPQDSYRHNIGTVEFGKDGALYVGNGDVDRNPAGPQNPATLIGAILRLDPMTGNGLPDNPFYDGDPTSNRSRTWVHGLRNPFRFGINPVTGEMLIGDVGQDAWESVHRGQAGKNYGWPCYEAGDHLYGPYQNTAVCQAVYAAGTRPPVHSYAHTADGGSVTGGDWYNGTAYPVEYRGAYFFADYSQGWVKVLRPDGAGGYTPVDFAASPETAGIVQVVTGADTNMYWVSITQGAVYRLRFTGAGNAAPAAVLASDTTQGQAPLTVHFNGAGSADPDGDVLAYSWAFGDGSASSAVAPTHTYSSEGPYDVTLTVTDPSGASAMARTTILVGTLPQISITQPSTDLVVNVGTQVPFRATASDQDDGDLTDEIEWTGALHHNVHTHPDYLPPTTGGSGSVVFADHEDGAFLRLCATVSNSSGLPASDCVDVRPTTTAVTVDSVPRGQVVSFGGTTAATPFTVSSNRGALRRLSAPATAGCRSFVGWSDGGAATHDIVVPNAATTYTANFGACTNPVLHLPFDEGGGSVSADASGSGSGASLLNGAGWGGGQSGSALALDGVNDAAAVVDQPSLNQFGSSLSVSAWVFRSVSQTGWRMVVSRQLGTSTADQFVLGFNGAEPRFGVNTAVGGYQFVGGGTTPVGEWVHLAGVYDGATMRLFVNGVERASRAKSGAVAVSSRPVLVGAGVNGTNALGVSEVLAGRVDDARLYARALTAAEVAALVP
jgi:glucose/arabinose dehydrogenase